MRRAWRWPPPPRPRPRPRRQATEAAAALPPLRAAESDARTALERHRVAQEQIAAEEERARAALADATTRLGQLGQDLAHAEQLRRDSEAAEVAAGGRRCGAGRGRARATPARAEAAEAAVAEAAEAVRARRGGGEPRDRGGGGGERPRPGRGAAARRGRAALAPPGPAVRRRSARSVTGSAPRRSIRRRSRLPAPSRRAAEAALASARDGPGCRRSRPAPTTGPALAAARERQAAADTALARLAAEADALAEVLAVKDGERWPPMVDALTVPPGLETALGAALGEELTSAADRDAARHWRELPPFDPAPKLPGGVTPLAALVQAPPALARVLSQTGLVDDEADRRGMPGRAGAGPGTGLARRCRLALGRLHDPGRHADRGGSPAAAAQPAVAAAARPGRGARRGRGRAIRRATPRPRPTRRHWRPSSRRAPAGRTPNSDLERARAAHQQLRAQAAEVAARLAAIDTRIEHLTVERDEADAALRRRARRRPRCPTWTRCGRRSRPRAPR